MRHVKLGAKTSTGQTIIDDGLLKDDLVVVETQGQLTDGLKVKFIEIVAEAKPAVADGLQ